MRKQVLKGMQRELRRRIRVGKDSYWRRIENQLQLNNVSGVWKSLRTISGYREQNVQYIKAQEVGE